MKEQLIGKFDETGYRIENESEVILYEAGNNPHDSDPSCSLPVGNGTMTLERIRLMCDQTGRDFAHRRQAEWNGIEYAGEKIEIPCTITIKIEQIKKLLLWAMEVTPNHWIRCEEWFSDRRREGEDRYDLVLRDHFVRYPFLDVDDGNRILGYLCFDSIVKALQFMAAGEDYNHKAIPMKYWEDLIQDKPNWDTADVFLQLAIMGKIAHPIFPAV